MPPKLPDPEPPPAPEETFAFTDEPPPPRQRSRPAPPGASKKWVLVVGIVCGGIAACVAFFLARGLVTTLLGGGANIADADWQEVAPPDAKFRVLMPGSPRQETRAVGTTTLQQYTVDRGGGRISFMVLFGHLSDGDVRAVPWEGRFDLALNGMLAEAPGSRLKSQKALTLDGHPGREFVVDVPSKGTAVTHIYGVRQGGRNLYLVLGAAGPDYEPDAPPVAKFFGSLRLERASPAALAAQLAAAAPRMRVDLIADLKKHGDAARVAVPTLVEVVKDTRDFFAGEAAAELLGDLGPAAAPAVPALTAVLKQQHPRKLADDNGTLRLSVAAALVRINPKDAFAREVLRDCTKDPNVAVRVMALGEFVKLDPAGNAADLDEIIRVWQTGTWERSNAADVLKKLGPLAAKAVPVLTKALRDNNLERRDSAVEVLEGLGPTARAALPALRALDVPGSPEEFRDAVRRACRKIEAAP
jgi:hypothetical protein